MRSIWDEISSTTTEEPILDECLSVRKGLTFLLSGVFTFLAGLLSILLWRLFVYIRCCKKAELPKNDESQSQRELKERGWAGELTSGATTTGRILSVLVLAFNVGSVIIFFIDSTDGWPERCQKWSENMTQQVDLAFNIFFMMYFFMRFIAASDKLRFMFEVYSIVDFLTIPQSFLSVYLDRTWIGFRFLRAIRLLSLSDILRSFNIVKTTSSLRVARIVSIFLSACLTAAGFTRLVESELAAYDRGHTYWPGQP